MTTLNTATQVGTNPKEIAKEMWKFDQNVDASSLCGRMWILEAAVTRIEPSDNKKKNKKKRNTLQYRKLPPSL